MALSLVLLWWTMLVMAERWSHIQTSKFELGSQLSEASCYKQPQQMVSFMERSLASQCSRRAPSSVAGKAFGCHQHGDLATYVQGYSLFTRTPRCRFDSICNELDHDYDTPRISMSIVHCIISPSYTGRDISLSLSLSLCLSVSLFLRKRQRKRETVESSSMEISLTFKCKSIIVRRNTRNKNTI